MIKSRERRNDERECEEAKESEKTKINIECKWMHEREEKETGNKNTKKKKNIRQR